MYHLPDARSVMVAAVRDAQAVGGGSWDAIVALLSGTFTGLLAEELAGDGCRAAGPTGVQATEDAARRIFFRPGPRELIERCRAAAGMEEDASRRLRVEVARARADPAVMERVREMTRCSDGATEITREAVGAANAEGVAQLALSYVGRGPLARNLASSFPGVLQAAAAYDAAVASGEFHRAEIWRVAGLDLFCAAWADGAYFLSLEEVAAFAVADGKRVNFYAPCDQHVPGPELVRAARGAEEVTLLCSTDDMAPGGDLRRPLIHVVYRNLHYERALALEGSPPPVAPGGGLGPESLCAGGGAESQPAPGPAAARPSGVNRRRFVAPMSVWAENRRTRPIRRCREARNPALSSASNGGHVTAEGLAALEPALCGGKPNPASSSGYSQEVPTSSARSAPSPPRAAAVRRDTTGVGEAAGSPAPTQSSPLPQPPRPLPGREQMRAPGMASRAPSRPANPSGSRRPASSAAQKELFDRAHTLQWVRTGTVNCMDEGCRFHVMRTDGEGRFGNGGICAIAGAPTTGPLGTFPLYYLADARGELIRTIRRARSGRGDAWRGVCFVLHEKLSALATSMRSEEGGQGFQEAAQFFRGVPLAAFRAYWQAVDAEAAACAVMEAAVRACCSDDAAAAIVREALRKQPPGAGAAGSPVPPERPSQLAGVCMGVLGAEATGSLLSERDPLLPGMARRVLEDKGLVGEALSSLFERVGFGRFLASWEDSTYFLTRHDVMAYAAAGLRRVTLYAPHGRRGKTVDVVARMSSASYSCDAPAGQHIRVLCGDQHYERLLDPDEDFPAIVRDPYAAVQSTAGGVCMPPRGFAPLPKPTLPARNDARPPKTPPPARPRTSLGTAGVDSDPPAGMSRDGAKRPPRGTVRGQPAGVVRRTNTIHGAQGERGAPGDTPPATQGVAARESPDHPDNREGAPAARPKSRFVSYGTQTIFCAAGRPPPVTKRRREQSLSIFARRDPGATVGTGETPRGRDEDLLWETARLGQSDENPRSQSAVALRRLRRGRERAGAPEPLGPPGAARPSGEPDSASPDPSGARPHRRPASAAPCPSPSPRRKRPRGAQGAVAEPGSPITQDSDSPRVGRSPEHPSGARSGSSVVWSAGSPTASGVSPGNLANSLPESRALAGAPPPGSPAGETPRCPEPRPPAPPPGPPPGVDVIRLRDDDGGGPLFYELVGTRSRKVGRVLCDTHGFVYTRGKQCKSGLILWECDRRRATKCGGRVWIDPAHGYVARLAPHTTHVADPGAVWRRLVERAAATKMVAACSQASSASRAFGGHVAEDAISAVKSLFVATNAPETPPDTLGADIRHAVAHTRIDRRMRAVRSQYLPAEPDRHDLWFQLDYPWLGPGFVVGDMFFPESRCVALQTPAQRDLLLVSDTLVVDATFKVVGLPFTQLLGVFAVTNDGVKFHSAPVGYALMSRKQKGLYVACLQAIVGPPGGDCRPKNIVLDFEANIWKAVQECIPGAALRGCAFHWARAVFRRLRKLGLAPTYAKDREFKKFARRVLALPYAPADEIPILMDRLGDEWELIRSPWKEESHDRVIQWLTYIREQWLEGMWPAEVWSVYGHRHRTSNVAEGGHNRLQGRVGQRRAGPYTLLGVLREECERAGDAAIRILRGEVVGSKQTWAVSNVEKRVQAEWGNYESGKKSAWDLLRACAHLAYDPYVSAHACGDEEENPPPREE